MVDSEKSKEIYKRYYKKHRIQKLLKESMRHDPIKVKEYNKKYYQKNKENIDKKIKEYDKNHPEDLKKRDKKYKKRIRNKKLLSQLLD
jgi:hypothetical protein